MTDTNTTETTTDEVTFGFDATKIIDTYMEERVEARRTYDAVADACYAKVSRIKDEMREALGWDGMSDAITLAFTERANERIKLDNLRQTKADMLKAAKEKRDKALHADPFMKYVDTVVRDEQGSGVADMLMRQAPFTLDSLKELANKVDWCQDFERIAERAARADVIPSTPTIKASSMVNYCDVPEKFGAKAGEDWVMDYEVPAYVRLTDEDGEARYTGNLAIESTVTYRRADSDS